MQRSDTAAELVRRKGELRRNLRARPSPDAATARRAGARVAQLLAASPEWSEARGLLLFAALPDEIPTRAIFEQAIGRGLPVFLPRCEDEGLRFLRVRAWESLVAGRYGVLEPEPGSEQARFETAEAEAGAEATGSESPAPRAWLWMVPGLAFDRGGGRLGRGGGHYDRALARSASSAFTVGLCYADQIVEAVPMAAHDRRVHAVLTERGWHRRG